MIQEMYWIVRVTWMGCPTASSRTVTPSGLSRVEPESLEATIGRVSREGRVGLVSVQQRSGGLHMSVVMDFY